MLWYTTRTSNFAAPLSPLIFLPLPHAVCSHLSSSVHSCSFIFFHPSVVRFLPLFSQCSSLAQSPCPLILFPTLSFPLCQARHCSHALCNARPISLIKSQYSNILLNGSALVPCSHILPSYIHNKD